MKRFREWLEKKLLVEGKSKDIKKILSMLERKGFRLEQGKGSIIKIYPPDKSMPFYFMHMGDEALHPLRRFAQKNWGIEDIRREEPATNLPKAI